MALALPTEARAILSPAVTAHEPEDAFGNLLAKSGSTSNNYLYAGEQFDPDLGLYYNRARYLNTDSGRFWSMDSLEGGRGDPISLHKYLYASANPISFSDPSGNFSLAEVAVTVGVVGVLDAIARPVVARAVGGAFAALGFVPGQHISISSLGVYGDAPLLLSDFGITDADFSENLFVQASQQLATDAISGTFSALGGKFLLGAFAEASAARSAAQDFSHELAESRGALAGRVAGQGGQVHHIIPWEMRTNSFVQKAARGGFRMNGPMNGTRLSTDVHFGSHPEYSTNVRMTLDLLDQAFPKATPGEAAALLNQYITVLRSDFLQLALTSTKLK